jgi:hypothetical protein
MTTRAAFGVSVFAFALLLAALPAQATDLQAFGELGGRQFRTACPSGQFVVGLSIKAGAWIDAVGPLCAPLTALAAHMGWPHSRLRKAVRASVGTSRST